MISILEETYLAAFQGAFILKPNIDDRVREILKKDTDPALRRALGDVSINVLGGLTAEEMGQDDAEMRSCRRSAAHLLMIRHGASPIYIAEKASDEYARFLRANYGVVPHERRISTLTKENILELMTTIPNLSLEKLKELAYNAAFNGDTGFAYQLSVIRPDDLSYVNLAANATLGSHLRFVEQLWEEQSLEIGPIVQAALRTTDFVNSVIALFHLSFMGDAFRAKFANELKSHHQAYNVDKLSAIATNIHHFMQEGPWYFANKW